MKVVWTNRAKRRLRQICERIADEAPQVARKVAQRIAKRSRQAGELPRSGKMVPEYEHENIRELKLRPYRIIYFIREELDRVDVLTVRHYHELLPDDLEKL